MLVLVVNGTLFLSPYYDTTLSLVEVHVVHPNIDIQYNSFPQAINLILSSQYSENYIECDDESLPFNRLIPNLQQVQYFLPFLSL